MRRYYSNKELYHAGKRGMRWGYNDGRRNGKRTADSAIDAEEIGERLNVLTENAVGRAEHIENNRGYSIAGARTWSNTDAGRSAQRASTARNWINSLMGNFQGVNSNHVNKGRDFISNLRRGYSLNY